MKNILIVLSFFLGGVAALITCRVILYNFEMYPKYKMLTNTIAVNHDYDEGILRSIYIYFNQETILSSDSCIKDLYATIYHGDMYVLEPRHQRYYPPQNIGFIGKINICNHNDINKWQSIKMYKNDVTWLK
jgi:hypothetical protein